MDRWIVGFEIVLYLFGWVFDAVFKVYIRRELEKLF